MKTCRVCGRDADIREAPFVDSWLCDDCCWSQAVFHALTGVIAGLGSMLICFGIAELLKWLFIRE